MYSGIKDVKDVKVYLEDGDGNEYINKKEPVIAFVQYVSEVIFKFLNVKWEQHKKKHSKNHNVSCECCGFRYDGVSDIRVDFGYLMYFPDLLTLNFFGSYEKSVPDIIKNFIKREYPEAPCEEVSQAYCGGIVATAEEHFCVDHSSIPNIRLFEIDDTRLVVIVSCSLFYSSDQVQPDVSGRLCIPFKFINGVWRSLQENTFYYNNTDRQPHHEFRVEHLKMDFLWQTFEWYEAVFATTPAEKLAVVVKYYLLAPDDSNPLTILLRSPQPTKGIAKQIESLLRGAIS